MWPVLGEAGRPRPPRCPPGLSRPPTLTPGCRPASDVSLRRRPWIRVIDGRSLMPLLHGTAEHSETATLFRASRRLGNTCALQQTSSWAVPFFFVFFFFYAFGNFPGAPLTQLLQSRPLAYGTLPAFRGRDVPSDTFPRVTHTFPTDPGAVGPAAGGRAKTSGEIPPDPAREEAELWDGVSGRCGQQGAGQGWGQPGFPTTK